MSCAPGATTSESEDPLDKARRTYQGMGFSETRVIGLLLRSGYSVGAVQSRFPNLCVSDIAAQPGRSSDAVSAATPAGDATPCVGTPRVSNSSNPLMPIAQSGKLQSVARRVGSHRQSTEPGSNVPVPVRKVETVDVGEAKQSPQEEGLSFQDVPLIQCTFPHGDPGEQTLFTRRNGRLELTLSTARPDTGLPYGVPARLLTIYCASEAKWNESPRISLGASVHEFLRKLDIPITRGERGSLRVYANQLMRLVYCAVTVDEHLRDDAGRKGLDIRPMRFVERA